MRIYTKNPDKLVFEISRRDWFRHGQDADWYAGDYNDSSSRPNIDIRKYGQRFFAIYVDNELLCVTVYRKGAMAVEAYIESLYAQLEQAEERAKGIDSEMLG